MALPSMRSIFRAAEAGYVPDALLRFGIRRLLKARLHHLNEGSVEDQQARLRAFVADASSGPIAPVPEQANRQHYEVPAEFFRLVLGRNLKYSCGYWPDASTTLDESEEAALSLTCERAGIADGMRILELGCGWGSLSLWMARHFPGVQVTAVSNSAAQRTFIESRAAEEGIENLRVITADMNDFDPGEKFDRVISVEMFEHMRNHGELMRRISDWLTADGRLFVHIFCHRQFTYPFELQGPGDWMAAHFFTGGMMPSVSLLSQYNDHLRLTTQWRWNGTQYARTCNAWLERLDSELEAIRPIFEQCYGVGDASLWVQRWRMFFMSCAELFAMNNGEEWYVTHSLFERQSRRSRSFSTVRHHAQTAIDDRQLAEKPDR